MTWEEYLKKGFDGEGAKDGDTMWVCDYREGEFNQLPARHLAPTKVSLHKNKTSEKRRLFSDYRFVVAEKNTCRSKKYIELYDSKDPTKNGRKPPHVFETEQEAWEHYLTCIDGAIEKAYDAIDEIQEFRISLKKREKYTKGKIEGLSYGRQV